MSELILSPESEQDLVDIWIYIAENSPVNADNYIDMLYNKCNFLSENPEIGVKRIELLDDLRSFPVDHYVLFYRLKNKGIELIRVLHASRDMYSIF